MRFHHLILLLLGWMTIATVVARSTPSQINQNVYLETNGTTATVPVVQTGSARGLLTRLSDAWKWFGKRFTASPATEQTPQYPLPSDLSTIVIPGESIDREAHLRAMLRDWNKRQESKALAASIVAWHSSGASQLMGWHGWEDYSTRRIQTDPFQPYVYAGSTGLDIGAVYSVVSDILLSAAKTTGETAELVFAAISTAWSSLVHCAKAMMRGATRAMATVGLLRSIMILLAFSVYNEFYPPPSSAGSVRRCLGKAGNALVLAIVVLVETFFWMIFREATFFAIVLTMAVRIVFDFVALLQYYEKFMAGTIIIVMVGLSWPPSQYLPTIDDSASNKDVDEIEMLVEIDAVEEKLVVETRNSKRATKKQKDASQAQRRDPELKVRRSKPKDSSKQSKEIALEDRPPVQKPPAHCRYCAAHPLTPKPFREFRSIIEVARAVPVELITPGPIPAAEVQSRAETPVVDTSLEIAVPLAPVPVQQAVVEQAKPEIVQQEAIELAITAFWSSSAPPQVEVRPAIPSCWPPTAVLPSTLFIQLEAYYGQLCKLQKVEVTGHPSEIENVVHEEQGVRETHSEDAEPSEVPAEQGLVTAGRSEETTLPSEPQATEQDHQTEEEDPLLREEVETIISSDDFLPIAEPLLGVPPPPQTEVLPSRYVEQPSVNQYQAPLVEYYNQQPAQLANQYQVPTMEYLQGTAAPRMPYQQHVSQYQFQQPMIGYAEPLVPRYHPLFQWSAPYGFNQNGSLKAPYGHNADGSVIIPAIFQQAFQAVLQQSPPAEQIYQPSGSLELELPNHVDVVAPASFERDAYVPYSDGSGDYVDPTWVQQALEVPIGTDEPVHVPYSDGSGNYVPSSLIDIPEVSSIPEAESWSTQESLIFCSPSNSNESFVVVSSEQSPEVAETQQQLPEEQPVASTSAEPMEAEDSVENVLEAEGIEEEIASIQPAKPTLGMLLVHYMNTHPANKFAPNPTQVVEPGVTAAETSFFTVLMGQYQHCHQDVKFTRELPVPVGLSPSHYPFQTGVHRLYAALCGGDEREIQGALEQMYGVLKPWAWAHGWKKSFTDMQAERPEPAASTWRPPKSASNRVNTGKGKARRTN